eukprot:GEMP01022287.1.p1 GENE.GEMP01022287.1~~GEMP01022287.1.p1  ORF type:complete len:606 (+),score=109.98 GEMP01022287.1:635-2452(+)
MFLLHMTRLWSFAFLFGVARADGRKRFLECYQGQDDGQILSLNVGVLIDAPMLQIFGGNSETAQRKISQVFFMANIVLIEQFNITIVPISVVIADEESKKKYTSKREAWMYDKASSDGRCPQEIDDRLNLFANSTQALNVAGAWVLFTGCAFATDTSSVQKSNNHLGLAIKDAICTVQPAAIVSYTALNREISTRVYHTFLHELGHMMGGRHPFEKLDENNKTKYPSGGWGLMDYDNGIWNGTLQFHPLHVEEMCTLINARICGENRKLNCTLLDYNPSLKNCWIELQCPKECRAAMIGDGVCQQECDVVACNFDYGDCACSPGCVLAFQGDGICHEACNTEACSADFGDCLCPNLVNNDDCHTNGACVRQCFWEVLPRLMTYYAGEILLVIIPLVLICCGVCVCWRSRKNPRASNAETTALSGMMEKLPERDFTTKKPLSARLLPQSRPAPRNVQDLEDSRPMSSIDRTSTDYMTRELTPTEAAVPAVQNQVKRLPKKNTDMDGNDGSEAREDAVATTGKTDGDAVVAQNNDPIDGAFVAIAKKNNRAGGAFVARAKKNDRAGGRSLVVPAKIDDLDGTDAHVVGSRRLTDRSMRRRARGVLPH